MHMSVIYVSVGSFIREKNKKKSFLGQFAMCQGHGTRLTVWAGLGRLFAMWHGQTDQASPRAVAMAHGEARLFAVWHRPKQTVEPRGRRAPMPVLPCAAPVDTR